METAFWEFCKGNGAAGVLLVALAGFAWIALPRIDKLIDHFIALNGRSAEIKPQLDRIEKQTEQGCRYEHSGRARPHSPATQG